MNCFHSAPVIVDATGTLFEGREEVRRHYETGFALMPDCRCDLRILTGNSGRGVTESFFRGTRPPVRESGRGCWCRGNRNRGPQDQGDPRLSSATFRKRGVSRGETSILRNDDGSLLSGLRSFSKSPAWRRTAHRGLVSDEIGAACPLFAFPRFRHGADSEMLRAQMRRSCRRAIAGALG
jgi:hypothetical protein